ncbi:MAG: hypothetical protein WBI04_07470 [Trichlorobacter sp.]
MINAPRYLLLALAGVAMVAGGLSASHRLKSPWDSLSALLVLIGATLVLLGALLAVLPRFFLE